jgi:hypothetical protein
MAAAAAVATLLAGAVVLAAYPVSRENITPSLHPGNFVAADDDQVCYELAATAGFDYTSELRGFKIDPTGNFSNANIDVTISSDGRYLAWELVNAQMLGVIVKGGPSFHLYNYQGTGLMSDGLLASPLQKKSLPQISHYNVCYNPEVFGEGCTPGYWRNHANRWVGVSPLDGFNATFGVTSTFTGTLGQAIWASGGGINALARHATAALLNAYGGVPNADGTRVDFPMTPAQVVEAMQAALAVGGDIEATQLMFAALNEAGCPLSGTSALPIIP